MADKTGELFARALAAKDAAALTGLLADQVDFQALTPRRHWQAATPAEVVDGIMLGQWFDAEDEIVRLESVSTGALPGREHVSYLLRVRTGGEEFLVEQQAYFDAGAGPDTGGSGDSADARITWLRILCSGFRPVS